MKTITKKDIINKLHKKIGLPKKTLHFVIDEFLEEFRKALELRYKVKMIRFGIFFVRQTNERPGKNFHTGDRVKIKSFKKVVLHLAPQFKKELHEEN
jgi:integration host factor subunit alpha